jgi:hypothetical protein
MYQLQPLALELAPELLLLDGQLSLVAEHCQNMLGLASQALGQLVYVVLGNSFLCKQRTAKGRMAVCPWRKIGRVI